MKIALIAMSGVRVRTERIANLGVSLPQFVNRGQVIASLPCLSLLILAALTPEDVDVVYVEVNTQDDEARIPKDIDLAAIGTYSAQALEAYGLAARLRTAGVTVVMGGLHATQVPDEAAQHVDAVVVGEAEETWPRLVEDFRAGRLQPRYVEERPGTYDLARSPMPRFDLLQGRGYNRVTVQTQRGCPWDCEFCAATKLYGPGYRRKPVDRVVAEVDALARLFPRPFLELADDNTFVHKAWAKDLMRGLMPYDVSWFTETDVSVADDEELLDLMRRAGCRQVLIGLETLSADDLNALDATGWKGRQRDRYLEAIRRIQSYGVSVNGCFILGGDSDTPETFRELRDFIEESGLLEVQLTVLTPFPGTRLHERLRSEGRLLYEDAWDRCTLFDINFQPRNMSVEELEDGLVWIMGQVYNEEQYLKRKRRYVDIVKRGMTVGWGQ